MDILSECLRAPKAMDGSTDLYLDAARSKVTVRAVDPAHVAMSLVEGPWSDKPLHLKMDAAEVRDVLKALKPPPGSFVSLRPDDDGFLLGFDNLSARLVQTEPKKARDGGPKVPKMRFPRIRPSVDVTEWWRVIDAMNKVGGGDHVSLRHVGSEVHVIGERNVLKVSADTVRKSPGPVSLFPLDYLVDLSKWYWMNQRKGYIRLYIGEDYPLKMETADLAYAGVEATATFLLAPRIESA